MTPEEEAIEQEWADQVKADAKELTRLMWQLIRCAPEEESALLADLRSLADKTEAMKADQHQWHANRKAKSAITRFEERQRASGEYADEKIARMIENCGEQGAQKVIDQNRRQALLSSLRHLSTEEIETLLSVDSAQVEVARAQIKLAEYERLAIEGKKDRLVSLALSNADLQKVMETRRQKIVNDQRKSRGGVVRIESGDGR